MTSRKVPSKPSVKASGKASPKSSAKAKPKKAMSAKERAQTAAARAVRVREKAKKPESLLAEAVKESVKVTRRDKGRRLNDAEIERILAVYSVLGNAAETGRICGCAGDTVSRLVQEAEEQGHLQDIRAAHRDRFVDEAWDCIMLAVNTIKDGLTHGYIYEYTTKTGETKRSLTRVSPGEASKVLKELHHATQLAQGKPTSIVEEIAEEMSEDEIQAEIARLESQMAAGRGRLQ